MKPFHESSTLAQIRRLRHMAEVVVLKYPIKVRRVDFIHHGENATFKVSAKEGKFLLRLHRDGYHTKDAILEELNWMKSLSEKTNLNVQKPVYSVDKNFVVSQHVHGFPRARYCDLLEWREGQIRKQGILTQNFSKVGTLTAQLHLSSEGMQVKHRRYWTPEGLLGKSDAKLGGLQQLKTLFPKDFPTLEKARALFFRELKKYEKNNSTRLIHADLHFGNLLWKKGGLTPIDFDDCGTGFPAYDLAVTLYARSQVFKKSEKKKMKAATEALLEGYTSVRALTEEDLRIIPYFMMARRMAMLGWLHQRRDNPRFVKLLRKNWSPTMRHVRAALADGPTYL